MSPRVHPIEWDRRSYSGHQVGLLQAMTFGASPSPSWRTAGTGRIKPGSAASITWNGRPVWAKVTTWPTTAGAPAAVGAR